ncbi:hypothetical protein BDR26DRAFT_943372 [Obelidium mucronatum]|nr:hypothetical protein BDR26DRAFT_943372 [Obelidium mucronatum]
MLRVRPFSTSSARRGPQNLIERIVQKYARDLPSPDYKVKQGDFVSIQPHHVMTHDNTGAVIGKFKAIGASKFNNPSSQCSLLTMMCRTRLKSTTDVHFMFD